VVCWAGMLYLPHFFPEQNFWQRAVVLFTTIGAASLAYLGSCFLLGVEETGEAARIVMRKLRRKSP